jgi:hypothetical protein
MRWHNSYYQRNTNGKTGLHHETTKKHLQADEELLTEHCRADSHIVTLVRRGKVLHVRRVNTN